MTSAMTLPYSTRLQRYRDESRAFSTPEAESAKAYSTTTQHHELHASHCDDDDDDAESPGHANTCREYIQVGVCLI